jgi:lipopolysaccharide transport protein LptA
MRPAPVAWLAALAVTASLGAGALAAEAEKPARENAAQRLGLRVARDAPMSIQADELEALREPDGRERVVFQRAVTVSQGDLQIECDWLEAIYPQQQDGGPERIVARGAVRIRQEGVEVTCAEAVFERQNDRAVCDGAAEPAVLRRGADVVQGRRIVFDLRQGKLSVSGGARVTVKPQKEPGR